MQKRQRPAPSLLCLLPLVVACTLPSPAAALMEIEEEHLSDITGEGIAFLPENAVMLLRGAGANEDYDSVVKVNRANDTGYIRYIPVGPLTDASLNNTIYGATTGKADIFLYGLAISRADGNSNSRLSATNPEIASWGTASNPWLLKVQSQSNVPNFDTGSGTGTVSYLTLEAPLYNTTLPTTAADGLDAYRLKVAYWGDIFNRKWDVAEGDATQFDVGGSGRQNRLRLQAIMDGVSLNGTNLKIFQTLGGATNAGGMSTSYNNTFGVSQLIRLNSGDGANVRAPVNTVTVTDNTVENASTYGSWALLHGGWDSGLSASQTSGNCNNGSSVTVSNNSGATGCQFMVQSRTRSDSKTRTINVSSAWTAASGGLGDHVFRLSTQETSGSGVDLSTPAINGGSAPTFAANEGIFFYNLNANLPLGSLQQPLTAGVAGDGRNLVLEVARIPNKAIAYNAIYTRYDNDPGGAAFTGSTCNVYQCGSSSITGYQGASATHGSIAIGTTVYDSGTNSLTAYKGADAAGVSFGNLVTVSGNTYSASDSATTTGSTTEARWVQRTSNTSTTWTYRVNSLGGTRTGTANQWSYGGTIVGALTGVTNATFQAFSTRYRYPIASGTGNTWSSNTTDSGLCGDSNCTYYGTIDNRNWTVADMKGLSWSTAQNNTLNTWLTGQGSAAQSGTIANAAATPVVAVPTIPNMPTVVNLGSAVIDGLLVQHMKFTTTGL